MIVRRLNYTINFTIVKKSMGWRRYFTISSNISFFTIKFLWNGDILQSAPTYPFLQLNFCEIRSICDRKQSFLKMTRQKLNSFRSNQTDVSCWVLLWKHKIMCRKFPEIRSLSYFKRINGLEFWCLQIPLKVVTFWDQTKLAKSCPANFVPLKKFRVRNNERVTPSDFVLNLWTW